jgi:hypothetical protein
MLEYHFWAFTNFLCTSWWDMQFSVPFSSASLSQDEEKKWTRNSLVFLKSPKWKKESLKEDQEETKLCLSDNNDRDPVSEIGILFLCPLGCSRGENNLFQIWKPGGCSRTREASHDGPEEEDHQRQHTVEQSRWITETLISSIKSSISR